MIYDFFYILIFRIGFLIWDVFYLGFEFRILLIMEFFLKRNMCVECCCYRKDYVNILVLFKIFKFIENYL